MEEIVACVIVCGETNNGKSLELRQETLQTSDKENNENSVALYSAIMCLLRNPKASALHYRISTVLSKLTTKSSFGYKFL